MTTKPEPLVPLEELGIQAMTAAEHEAWASVAGVVVRYDYLDRASVSLPDAYKVAESRRAAEREWSEAESARHAEHAKAVAELQQRVNAEFVAARTARLAANVGAGLFGGQVEMDGSATNEGLQAARVIWAAAPAAVRDAVSSVEFEESGTINVVPLSLAMPLATISDYAHSAASQRRY